MNLKMEMTTDRNGVTETGTPVPVGTRCIYRGHVSGGMVRVQLPTGVIDVVHPAIFPSLR